MKREHLGLSSLRTTVVLVLRLITLVATLMLVTRLLDASVYGDYVSVATLAVLLGLLPNLGAGYIGMARAVHDEHAGADIWRYGWPLTLCLGVLLSLPYLIIAQRLAGGRIETIDMLLIAASELFAIPLIALLGSLFQAKHRVATGQIIAWLPLGGRVIAATACLAVPAWKALHPFVLGQMIATFAGLALAIVVTSRFVRLGERPRLPTRQEWRDGSSYAAMNLVAANPAEIDKVLAPLFLRDHLAGLYAAASRVMISAVMPVTALLLTSQPRLFEQAARPAAGTRPLHGIVAWASFGLGILAMIGLDLIAPIVPVFLGPSFTDVAMLLPWVSIALPFLCLRLAAGTVLAAQGKPLERLLFETFGVAALLPLLWLGAHVAQARGMGVALACAEAMMASLGWWRIVRRYRISAN